MKALQRWRNVEIVPYVDRKTINDFSLYNPRRNNMDFGTCFVVVLVVILYLLAWIDDRRRK